MIKKRAYAFILIFAALSAYISLNTGAAGWGMSDKFILMNIRLPRMAGAFVVGAGLALAGAIFQAILKNPLAAPYITGTSAGAALGVALASLAGLNSFSSPIAFLSGLGVSAAVYYIAAASRKNMAESLLLAGVIMSSLLSAITFLIMILNQDSLYRILFFITGSLQFVSPRALIFPAVALLFSFVFFLLNWRRLDIMTLGGEEAISLGVEVNKKRKIFFILSTLIVASGVSLGGIIGFVGLAVPHILRMALGAGHRKLLTFSLLFGGSFLVFSDALARGLFSPMEIPVGIITAFFGAPFFLYLLLKR